MEKYIGLFGLFVFIGICYLFSTNRKAIKWKPVIGGCVLQFLFALFILIIGSILQLDKSDYLIILGTIFSVLTLEIINTSIESLVDLVIKKKFSNLAKIAKDCSAGAVLLASINSVIIGLCLFIPKIKLLFLN